MLYTCGFQSATCLAHNLDGSDDGFTVHLPRTMFQKIWDQHVVHAEPGKQTILYIDLHLVHEVTSPQAFEGCGWPAGPSAARV